jgi:hypothetical protein
MMGESRGTVLTSQRTTELAQPAINTKTCCAGCLDGAHCSTMPRSFAAITLSDYARRHDQLLLKTAMTEFCRAILLLDVVHCNRMQRISVDALRAESHRDLPLKAQSIPSAFH